MKKKEKIAFVVVRYGKDINGGAEYHCRMLAERLVEDYDVHVLTTCVENYDKGGNTIPEGIEDLNGVLVHRFKVNPVVNDQNREITKKAKSVRRLRMFLHHIGCLKLISYFKPVWKWRRLYEIGCMKACIFYSTSLHQFISQHKDDYKVFITFTIDFSPFYYTAILAGEKTIAIPTLHNHKTAFRGILTEAFSKIAYVGFNTKTEQNLAKRIFSKGLGCNGIISVGVENIKPTPWIETKQKYRLPDKYLLFVGRVNSGKLGKLFQNFIAYKKKYPNGNLQLVLVGGVPSVWTPFQHEDIMYTGFVSDEEKITIIQHATVVVNPSKYESLSLILLESFNQGRAVLVNGKCNVLKGHCIRSGYAAWYYTNQNDFIKKLHLLEHDEILRMKMGEKGKHYVEENYNWPLIMGRMKEAIEQSNTFYE